MAKRIIVLILVIFWLGLIFSYSGTVESLSAYQTKALFEKTVTFGIKILRGIGLVNRTYSQEQIDNFVNNYHLVFRKFCHFTIYFILAVFVSSAIKNFTIRFPLKAIIIVAIGFCFLYSITDEIHQLFVPGRSGNIKDCLIDTLGATLGAHFYYYAHIWFKKIKRKWLSRKLAII
ncbi:MAG: VanZ family protein [Clostridia bacterium]|nr:VanZ family protein [Clostridia bacterium]